MIFINAKTIDGDYELFNLEKIISIKPNDDNGTTKILMGAGLYWTVITSSITYIDSITDLISEIKGEF